MRNLLKLTIKAYIVGDHLNNFPDVILMRTITFFYGRMPKRFQNPGVWPEKNGMNNLCDHSYFHIQIKLLSFSDDITCKD